MLKFFVLVIGIIMPVAAYSDAFYTSTDVEASSEPVSIRDMIHGWDGSVQRGDYAFADATARFGFNSHNVNVYVERRYFYSLKFTPDTVDWYVELDRGEENSTAYNIDLDVQMFDARGLGIGYQFSGESWSFQPSFTLYRLGHYQFGELTGLTSTGEGLNASATLDYYFDDDKILDYQAEEDLRFGYSLSVAGSWRLNSDWSLGVHIRDLLNIFEFFQASHREGCINVGQVDETVCGTGRSSIEGKDSNEDYLTSIMPTLMSSIDYQPMNLSAELYWHDRYTRLLLAKDWQLPVAKVGVMATTLNQLGVRILYQGFALRYMTDNIHVSEARDAVLNIGYTYDW